MARANKYVFQIVGEDKPQSNNQKIGKAFELEWMDHLASLGMWVHFMQPAPDGSQPFDVMAIDDRYGIPTVYAYDCKTLSSTRFPLSRIEDNQRLAFESLNRRGVHNTYFVIKNKTAIYLVPSQEAITLKDMGEKSILLGDSYAYLYLKQDND